MSLFFHVPSPSIASLVFDFASDSQPPCLGILTPLPLALSIYIYQGPRSRRVRWGYILEKIYDFLSLRFLEIVSRDAMFISS